MRRGVVAIEVKDKGGKVLRKYHMPSHVHLMVQDGENVEAGDVLAKIPLETTETKDITGGLPRVVELFEARKPKDPAVISEIDGIVKDGGVVKGQRKMIIVPDDGLGVERSGDLLRPAFFFVSAGPKPIIDRPDLRANRIGHPSFSVGDSTPTWSPALPEQLV